MIWLLHLGYKLIYKQIGQVLALATMQLSLVVATFEL